MKKVDQLLQMSTTVVENWKLLGHSVGFETKIQYSRVELTKKLLALMIHGGGWVIGGKDMLPPLQIQRW